MAEAEPKTLSDKLKEVAAADNRCHRQFPFQGDDSFALLAQTEEQPFSPVSLKGRVVEP